MEPPGLTLPERLLRETRKGRLVVFVEAGEGLREKIRVLPAGVWFESSSEEPGGITAGQIEEGELRAVPAGSVVALGSVDALGTPRRPTRFRAWLEQVLGCRTALVIGECAAPRSLARQSFERRHFVVPGNETVAFIDALSEQSRGAHGKAPPPLPGVISYWGIGLLMAAAVAAVASWLMLYVSYSAAQNWRWVHLVPGGIALVSIFAALVPWLADVMAGRQLPLPESYARFLGRWSRRPRTSLAVVALLLSAAGPRWISRQYVPATFLVVYEAAYVTSQEGNRGACKAEEPCVLVVPKDGHLHFEGAEGACGTDLPEEAGMVVIDMQQDSCGLGEAETGPDTRGG